MEEEKGKKWMKKRQEVEDKWRKVRKKGIKMQNRIEMKRNWRMWVDKAGINVRREGRGKKRIKIRETRIKTRGRRERENGMIETYNKGRNLKESKGHYKGRGGGS